MTDDDGSQNEDDHAENPARRAELIAILRAPVDADYMQALSARRAQLRAMAREQGESHQNPRMRDVERLWEAILESRIDGETRPLFVECLVHPDGETRHETFRRLVGIYQVDGDDPAYGLAMPELVAFLRAEARYGVGKSFADAIDILAAEKNGLGALLGAADVDTELPLVLVMAQRFLHESRKEKFPHASAELHGLLRAMSSHPDPRVRAASAAILLRTDKGDVEARATLREAIEVGGRAARWHVRRTLEYAPWFALALLAEVCPEER